MAIRKRKWRTQSGKIREAWIADYYDSEGNRFHKQFDRESEAKTFLNQTIGDMRDGIHIPDRASITVEEAGELWIDTLENDPEHTLEKSTLAPYKQHLKFHINPIIGHTKLKDLDVPGVEAFLRVLAKGDEAKGIEPRSPAMIRKVRVSLGAIISNAQRLKRATSNPVRDVRPRRKSRRGGEGSQGYKLKIGVDIPAPQEASAFIAALTGSSWRPLLLTAIFTGLRASELRGLRWEDVELGKRRLRVSQRADAYNVIGNTKSEAGERTVPLPPLVVNTLREWKLKCPKGDHNLVFPNGAGNIESHPNIVRRGLQPAMIRAGISVRVLDPKGEPVLDDEGEALVAAKYTGLHALRHFYASWCINRKADGGLELPPKNVQQRLGHANIQMTLDTYGHLFPASDDGAEMEAGERALIGLVRP